ncbi:HTH-type transcriptional repressor PurR, partial [Frankliniella fusca]
VRNAISSTTANLRPGSDRIFSREYGAFPTESLMEFHLNQAVILLSFKLRFKKTVGLLSLDLKAIMYDCSSILRM